MNVKSKILVVTFLGLHIPLVCLTFAAILLPFPDPKPVLVTTLMSTIVGAVLTLWLLNSVLDREGSLKTQKNSS